MVRLLSTAKNALQNNSKVFSQAVFNSLSKAYSEESLSEIKEELRALYESTEIETINLVHGDIRQHFQYPN